MRAKVKRGDGFGRSGRPPGPSGRGSPGLSVACLACSIAADQALRVRCSASKLQMALADRWLAAGAGSQSGHSHRLA